MKKRITITLDDAILEEFKRFCTHNGMKISTKIERLIADAVNKADSSERESKKSEKKEQENLEDV
ncbi:MAG: hypothetical protein NTV63_02165 [Candidatus Woesearchaeota archaeon]|nr:hypothetical protein [Candidatus Woesearchaeota archaeon]